MDEAQLDRVVGAQDDGARVDQVLARWLEQPRAQVQQRLAAGEVEVDGDPVGKSCRLRAGQRVVVASPVRRTSQSPPPDSVPIRYDDEHLCVVAKPAGLVVHAGSGVRDGTLVDALRAMGVELAAGEATEHDRSGIVHRLDRGTSGLIVVAKTEPARQALVQQLKERRVRREYWALVDGIPDPPRATIDAPIGRSPTRRTRFAIEAGGRPAVTHYDVVVEHGPVAGHGPVAELAVRLETGRTHQIRVHLAAVGHPVVGDRVYGASPVGAALGLERPALHARRLVFDHPITGATVDVDEPLPDDLERAVAALEPA